MFIAIMATILPMFERISNSRVQSPEGYIWTTYIVLCFKGMLMIMVFCVNGVVNDFFIGVCFYATTWIGHLYFKINPYQDPFVQSSMILSKKSDKNE